MGDLTLKWSKAGQLGVDISEGLGNCLTAKYLVVSWATITGLQREGGGAGAFPMYVGCAVIPSGFTSSREKLNYRQLRWLFWG